MLNKCIYALNATFVAAYVKIDFISSILKEPLMVSAFHQICSLWFSWPDITMAPMVNDKSQQLFVKFTCSSLTFLRKRNVGLNFLVHHTLILLSLLLSKSLLQNTNAYQKVK